MNKKNYSIDQLSSSSARRAQGQAALLQSDLKKLRSGLANMDRLSRTSKIKSKRTWAKKTTKASSLLELFDEIESFSTAQKASKNLALLVMGQRIR